MNLEQLKPCPCCGSNAILRVMEPHTHLVATFMVDYDGGEFVECSQCTMASSSIEDWNRRTQC